MQRAFRALLTFSLCAVLASAELTGKAAILAAVATSPPLPHSDNVVIAYYLLSRMTHGELRRYARLFAQSLICLLPSAIVWYNCIVVFPKDLW